MRRPVGLFQPPEKEKVHLALEAGGVAVHVHEQLVESVVPEGGEIEVALGSWGFTYVRLARPLTDLSART